MFDFRNRWLSPSLGRWGRNDPIGFVAGDVNLSRGFDNNPIDITDPLGLRPDKKTTPVSTGTGGASTPARCTVGGDFKKGPSGTIPVLVLYDNFGKREAWYGADKTEFTMYAKKYPHISLHETDFAETVFLLNAVVAKYGKVQELRIYSHGHLKGSQMITSTKCLKDMLATKEDRDLIESLGKCIAPGGTLKLYGCEVGKRRWVLEHTHSLLGEKCRIEAGTTWSAQSAFLPWNDPWQKFDVVIPASKPPVPKPRK
jgi:hypothetical protein